MTGQLDYIFFFYGLSFLVMGLLCFLFSRQKGTNIAWFYLGLFALVHGANEWLDLIALNLYDNITFFNFRILVLALSFLFLMEFARRTAKNFNIEFFSKSFYVILAAAAIPGFFIDTATANVIIRYVLGLPASLMTFYVLYRVYPETSKHIKYLSFVFAAYALATGFFVPKAGFFPASAVNYETFISLFFVPIQLIRGLIAAASAALIWRYYEELRAKWYKQKGYLLRQSRTGYSISLGFFIALLLIGWTVTEFVGQQEAQLIKQRAVTESGLISSMIKDSLLQADRAVKVMSMSPWITPFVASRTPEKLKEANIILDRFNEEFNLNVCYILDLKGKVIASSNRDKSDSFVGHYFDFRPYFRNSLKGKLSNYLAVGIITRNRGYYSSAPVYSRGKVTGVIVAKKDIESIESKIDPRLSVMLADRDGVIFLSTNKDLLYRALWPIDKKTAQKKIEEKQYVRINTDPVMSARIEDEQLITLSGKKLMVEAESIERENWTLYTLQPAGLVTFARFVVIFIMSICMMLFIGLIAFMNNRENMLVEATLDREQLSITLQSIGDAMITTDAQGRIIIINTVAEELLAVKAQDAIGKNIEDVMKIVDETTRKPIDNPVLEVLRTRKPVKLKNHAVLIAADTSEKNISDSASPIMTKNASLFMGVVLVFRDVTERIKTENLIRNSSVEWEKTFNSMSEGITIQDADFNIIKVNDTICKVLNMDKKEILGKKCYQVFHKKDSPLNLCPMVVSLTSKKFEQAEIFEPLLDKWLKVSTTPLFDSSGKIDRIVHVVEDITSRKLHEEEVLSSKQNAEKVSAATLNILEDLTETKQKIEKYSKDLEEALKIKSDFTSMVSHELRTPLTAIKEGIAIVLDGTSGNINEKQQEFLDIAKRNLDRLHRLIDNVLDFSKLEAHKLQLEKKKNSISGVIREVVKNFEQTAQSKGLYIKAETEESVPEMIFDRDKIEQVLVNLIGNAVKFTDKGGVKVIASKNEQEKAVHVCVEDTGIGIPQESLANLFQKYYQLGGIDNRKVGGTGLGLAISKEIITQHNGRIWVESTLGQGSRFCFTLPIE